MKLIARNLGCRIGAGAVLGCIAVLVCTQVALGDVITNSPGLPPNSGAYMTAADVHSTYSGDMLTAVLSNVRHKPFLPPISIVFMGGNEIETFNSLLTGDVSINGGPLTPFAMTGPVSVTIFGRTSDSELGTFSTEMTQMDLSAGPSGPMVRESPTLQSSGQTTVSDAGGGLFRISSFFDVFTELSVDGGNGWIPQSNGPTHVELSDVPEPRDAMSLAGLAGAGALVWFGARRRRIWNAR